jgi:hypothetical protein
MRRGSLFLPEVTMPLEELARHPRWAAAAQNNLGYALQRLGEREAGTARLEEAANAYRGRWRPALVAPAITWRKWRHSWRRGERSSRRVCFLKLKIPDATIWVRNAHLETRAKGWSVAWVTRAQRDAFALHNVLYVTLFFIGDPAARAHFLGDEGDLTRHSRKGCPRRRA